MIDVLKFHDICQNYIFKFHNKFTPSIEVVGLCPQSLMNCLIPLYLGGFGTNYIIFSNAKGHQGTIVHEYHYSIVVCQSNQGTTVYGNVRSMCIVRERNVLTFVSSSNHHLFTGFNSWGWINFPYGVNT
jgi:hypothetical protein